MKERVLVTGTSGRIGGAIASELSRDYEVVGLDRQPGRFTTLEGDITSGATVARALAGVCAIVHTAALHAPHVGKASAQAFVDVNVGGTQHLLAAARRHGIRRFVYTSTTSLYGDAMISAERAVWVDETLTPVPRDVYDETKLAAERACADAAVAGTSCISLRMSRCFPEPEPLEHIYRLYRGVDARDVAAAHRLALTGGHTGFDVFNVSAPSPFQRDDLRQLFTDAPTVIARYFPWAVGAFAERGWRLPDKIDRVYVTDKARSVLGYAPRHDFASLFGR